MAAAAVGLSALATQKMGTRQPKPAAQQAKSITTSKVTRDKRRK